MKLLAVVAASLALSGCISIVEVKTDGKEPDIAVYPFGVRVDRGQSKAVTVTAKTIGFASSCGAYGAGYSDITCTVIDPSTCGVAVVYPDRTTDEDLLGRISDQTRARCLHNPEGPSP